MTASICSFLKIDFISNIRGKKGMDGWVLHEVLAKRMGGLIHLGDRSHIFKFRRKSLVPHLELGRGWYRQFINQ